MLRYVVTVAALCGLYLQAAGQSGSAGADKAPVRSEIIGYSTREGALGGNRDDESYYLPLSDFFTTQRNDRTQHRTMVEIPRRWLDREVFLHIEGGMPAMRIYVNDRYAGYAEDSRTPAEFDLTPLLHEDLNTIAVEPAAEPAAMRMEAGLPDNGRPAITTAYIYSQPRLRIADYRATIVPDSTGRHAVLSLDIVAANGYNYLEPLTIGYDIYSPEDQLKYYDMREIAVPGKGLDTLHFETPIYGAMERLWSEQSPKLYRVTMYVKRAGRITEYVTAQVGAGTTTWKDDRILRNGEPVTIRAVHYNASATEAQTSKELKALKAKKYNTIYVDYPQPNWFYNLCDSLGVYVIDQANNHAPGGDRKKGGAASNDPAFRDAFIRRVENMYLRNRNHSCIVGWSLGGDCGNGYNMYKAYQWLKSQDDSRPVLYRDAGGEWNSDLTLPAAQ